MAMCGNGWWRRFNKGEDNRNRPAEFSERDGILASALLERLGGTLQEAAEVLSHLTESDLLTVFEIQGHTVTGLHAIYQVVEHFGLHYGQILYINKMLSGKDLGFYRELSKTGRA